MDIHRRGLILILASPSGAGKSTLSRLLVQDDPTIHLSISTTTRKRRPSEVDGVHYRFVTEKSFKSMCANDEFLEWAEVYGHLYGTPIGAIEDRLSTGQDVLFDIDWQGTAQVQKRMPKDVVSVFVLPPSMIELERRLNRRAEDTQEVIMSRLQDAKCDIAEYHRFDYIVVNDDLDRTYAAIRAILCAERLRRSRLCGIESFISNLLSQ